MKTTEEIYTTLYAIDYSDDNQITFEVKTEWLKQQISNEYNNLDEFLDDYNYDYSWTLYELASKENVVKAYTAIEIGGQVYESDEKTLTWIQVDLEEDYSYSMHTEYINNIQIAIVSVITNDFHKITNRFIASTLHFEVVHSTHKYE